MNAQTKKNLLKLKKKTFTNSKKNKKLTNLIIFIQKFKILKKHVTFKTTNKKFSNFNINNNNIFERLTKFFVKQKRKRKKRIKKR